MGAYQGAIQIVRFNHKIGSDVNEKRTLGPLGVDDTNDLVSLSTRSAGRRVSSPARVEIYLIDFSIDPKMMLGIRVFFANAR